MTKKHFEQLAAALRTAKPDPDAPKEANVRWVALVRDIANICAAANPSFRRQTFLTACGLDA